MSNWKTQLAFGCAGVILGLGVFVIGHGQQLLVFMGCFLMLAGLTGITLAVYVRRQGHH